MYYRLPTKKRQALVLFVSIIGYGLLVWFADFLFPMLSDVTKKKLTQLGIVSLYLASLSAGLAFVWSSKARHNVSHATTSKQLADNRLILLVEQTKLLGNRFENEMASARKDIAEAEQQLTNAGNLPSVYDFAGASSLILVAIGTLLCFVGAG